MVTITSVSDRSPNPSQNNLSLFFIRQGQNKEIGRWKWFQMLVVEAIFGEELFENLVICCAAGTRHSLSRLVPRGLLIDRARELLIEVLFFKHALQYYMLTSENFIVAHVASGASADLTNVQFGLKPGVAYQIIYFRRVYHVIFLIANAFVNLGLYLFHDSVTAAVGSFAIVQLFKRAKV